MGRMNELTGRTFGLLYVIDRAEDMKPGRPSWNCRCKCGNLVRISSTHLTKANGTKSCGCNRRVLKHDLTGQEFGYLLVLGVCTKSRYQSNETRWKCKCQNCGRIIDLAGSTLRRGNPYGHCRCTRFKKT